MQMHCCLENGWITRFCHECEIAWMAPPFWYKIVIQDFQVEKLKYILLFGSWFGRNLIGSFHSRTYSELPCLLPFHSLISNHSSKSTAVFWVLSTIWFGRVDDKTHHVFLCGFNLLCFDVCYSIIGVIVTYSTFRRCKMTNMPQYIPILLSFVH